MSSDVQVSESTSLVHLSFLKHLRQFNTPYTHLDGHVANLLDGDFVNFKIVQIMRRKWKKINIIHILLKITTSIIDNNC